MDSFLYIYILLVEYLSHLCLHVNMHLWYKIIYSSLSAPPLAPTITRGRIHLEEVTVTWTSVPTATSYSVSINGHTPISLPADTCTYSFTRQANITAYTFSVVAINGAGSSSPATIEIHLGTCMSNNAIVLADTTHGCS